MEQFSTEWSYTKTKAFKWRVNDKFLIIVFFGELHVSKSAYLSTRKQKIIITIFNINIIIAIL